MGSRKFGAVGTIAVVIPAPPLMKTARGADGCATASDRS